MIREAFPNINYKQSLSLIRRASQTHLQKTKKNSLLPKANKIRFISKGRLQLPLDYKHNTVKKLLRLTCPKASKTFLDNIFTILNNYSKLMKMKYRNFFPSSSVYKSGVGIKNIKHLFIHSNKHLLKPQSLI